MMLKIPKKASLPDTIPIGAKKDNKKGKNQGEDPRYIINPYYQKEKLSFKETLDLISLMSAQLLSDVEYRDKK